MIFAMAFDELYGRMASAVIHALNFFHRDPYIVVFAHDPANLHIKTLSERYRNIEVARCPHPQFHFGQWHPLIWAKLEAFRLETKESVMFLDADMIVYRELSVFEKAFEESGRCVGASSDFAPFVKQFNSGFDFYQHFFDEPFQDLTYLRQPAFNAGAIVLRPDRVVYRDIMRLAHRFHEITFYPEQAILNLYAYLNGGWCRLDDLSIMPFSSRVLAPKPDYGMLHFFTPRPDFMLQSVIRDGEPTLSDMMSRFASKHGREYPLGRIESDFFMRLQNRLT